MTAPSPLLNGGFTLPGRDNAPVDMMGVRKGRKLGRSQRAEHVPEAREGGLRIVHELE